MGVLLQQLTVLYVPSFPPWLPVLPQPSEWPLMDSAIQAQHFE